MIERAALSAGPDDIAAKLRNAPAWVRRMTAGAVPAVAPVVNHGGRKPEQLPPAKPLASRQYCGWIAGCVAPGVALPCFNHADKRSIPEQFTPNCWAGVFEQFQKSSTPILLRWGHEGGTLATTKDFGLMIDVRPVVGLTFDARLTDDALGRTALEAAAKSGLAVSIAYKRAKTWTVERDGKTIRVVDAAEVDHIAVLPSSQTPAYPGARCFSARGVEAACPGELRRAAELHAWATLKREQGL